MYAPLKAVLKKADLGDHKSLGGNIKEAELNYEYQKIYATRSE